MNDNANQETVSVEKALVHARRLLSSDPQKAADQARAVIEAEPGIAEAYLLLAIALRTSGELEEAQLAEDQAIECAQRDPVIIRAKAQISAGEYASADRLLTLYLTDTPNDAVAIHLRAQLHLSLGHPEEAEQLFRRTLALAPSYAAARRDLESLMTRSGPGSDLTLPPVSAEEEWFTSKWDSDSDSGSDAPPES